MALCQGITRTRRRGLTHYFDRDQSSRPLPTSALGWDEGKGLDFLTSVLLAMNYARDEDLAHRKAQGMARLERGKYPALILFPLTRIRVEPHLVLVFGNPAQVMRLVQAASRWTGERVAAGFGGIGGFCNEGIARNFLEQEPRVALPATGTVSSPPPRTTSCSSPSPPPGPTGWRKGWRPPASEVSAIPSPPSSTASCPSWTSWSVSAAHENKSAEREGAIPEPGIRFSGWNPCAGFKTLAHRSMSSH